MPKHTQPDPFVHQPTVFRPSDLPMMYPTEACSQDLQRKVVHLTRSMHHNLRMAALRGETLDEMQRRLGEVETGSKVFLKSSTKVERNIWWEQASSKYIIISVAASLLILFVVWIAFKKIIPLL